jgi:hypothetical protein
MADESIDTLKAQIASLTRENTRLVSENTRRKAANRDLTAKLATASADLTQSNSERDRYKSRAEKNPAGDNEELEGLRTTIRSYKHRDGLSELAYGPDIGLNRSVPIDRLMKLIDYKPVADEFDPKAAKQMLIALKDSDAYLFGETAVANGQPPRQGHVAAALAPGVAALGSALGRGSSPSPLEAQALSEEQLRDPVFMSSYHAQQRIAARK